MKIIAVPAFDDNYLWLIKIPNINRAYIVDPGDADAVESALKTYSLELAGIIITHHRWDHTNGIKDLIASRQIPVYGPRNSAITGINYPLDDGDAITLEQGIEFQVMSVPGHTLDHLAYYSDTEKLLFCGDTLFAGGCGRLFEGTAEQMYRSLQRLALLPRDTAVYCTHEYTIANLTFALAVEPNNIELQARMASATALRQQALPTLPSTIALECDTNPFLRCKQTDIINVAEQRTQRNTLTDAEVFACLRDWKDNF